LIEMTGHERRRIFAALRALRLVPPLERLKMLPVLERRVKGWLRDEDDPVLAECYALVRAQ
jgi:hypothetical protein